MLTVGGYIEVLIHCTGSNNDEWLIVIFVPAGCTGLFQPCDVSLQRVYRHHTRHSASDFFTAEVHRALEGGTSPVDVKLSTTLPSLRDATVS